MLAHARTTLTSLSKFLEAWGEAADSLVASELVGSCRKQKLLFEEQLVAHGRPIQQPHRKYQGHDLPIGQSCCLRDGRLIAGGCCK